MVIAATVGPPMVVVAGLRRAAPTEPATPAPPSEASRARRFGVSGRGMAFPREPTSAASLCVPVQRRRTDPDGAPSGAGAGSLERFGQLRRQIARQLDPVAVGG